MRQHNPQGMPHVAPSRTPPQDYGVGGGGYSQDTYRPYNPPSSYPADLHSFQGEPSSTKKPGEERRQPTAHQQVLGSQGMYAPPSHYTASPNYMPGGPLPGTRATSPIRPPPYAPESTLHYQVPPAGPGRYTFAEDMYAPSYMEPDWRWQSFREFLVSEPFESRRALQYELFEWHMDMSERLNKVEVAKEFLRMLQASRQQIRAGGMCVLDEDLRRQSSRPRQRDPISSETARATTPSRREYWDSGAGFRADSHSRRLDLDSSYRADSRMREYPNMQRADSRLRDNYGFPRDAYGRPESRPRDSYGRSDSRPRDSYGHNDSRVRNTYTRDGYQPEARDRPPPRQRDLYTGVDFPVIGKEGVSPSDRPQAASGDVSEEHTRVPSVKDLTEHTNKGVNKVAAPTNGSAGAPDGSMNTAVAAPPSNASPQQGATRARLAKEIILTSDTGKKVHQLLQLCEGEFKIFTFEEFPEEKCRQHWIRLTSQFLCEGPASIPGVMTARPGDKICFATLLHTLNPNLQTLAPSHPKTPEIKRFLYDFLKILAEVANHSTEDIVFVVARKINKISGETQIMEFDVPVNALCCMPLTGPVDPVDRPVLDFKHPTIQLSWDLQRTWIASYDTATKPSIELSNGSLRDAVLVVIGFQKKVMST